MVIICICIYYVVCKTECKSYQQAAVVVVVGAVVDVGVVVCRVTWISAVSRNRRPGVGGRWHVEGCRKDRGGCFRA